VSLIKRLNKLYVSSEIQKWEIILNAKKGYQIVITLMSLVEKISSDLINAMKVKDKVASEAIRNAKTAFVLARAEKVVDTLQSIEDELKIIQNFVRQSREPKCNKVNLFAYAPFCNHIFHTKNGAKYCLSKIRYFSKTRHSHVSHKSIFPTLR
jgi:hypothetical protein